MSSSSDKSDQEMIETEAVSGDNIESEEEEKNDSDEETENRSGKENR